MSERGDGSFERLRYVCPICGEKTTFGGHFCKGEPEPKPKGRFAGIAKRVGVALVGLTLIEAMLLEMIGIYSLYVLAALALGTVVVIAIRRSKPGEDEDEGNL
jgi:hypothetical protein